jgi:hypothetical protein
LGEPRPCVVCGDVPERIIQIVEQVVEHQPAERAPLHAACGGTNLPPTHSLGDS